MMPILYESTETSFITNGLCRLTDCLSCVVTEERNGIYECDFEYPINGAYYDKLECGRIIGCRHDDSDDIQPFDIVSYSRPINGVVSFHAVHISYRQTEMVARGTNINSLASAFNMLKHANPSNPFEYEADFTSTSFMAAADGIPRSVRQMLGGVEGSILDSYGGEYEWDKFTVRLWRNRGEQKDITIRYGLNLTDYSEDADYFGTYTSVIPYWKGTGTDGKEIAVVGSRVDSGLYSYSGRNACIPLDLSDKFEQKPAAAQLQSFALSQMQSKNANLPSQSISVNFVNLTEDERANVRQLIDCKLCDSIRVVFPRYKMEGYFKIVKTTFDVLAGRFTEFELGNLSTTLSQAMGITNTKSQSASFYSLSNVVSYFKTPTQAMTYTINQLSSDWTSFVYITDPHGSGNRQHSQAIALYLLDNTPASMLVLGGDYCASGWLKTEYDTYMRPFKRSGLIDDIYAVMGNHETYSNGSAEAKQSIYDDFLADKSWITGVPAENYYYFDDEDRKIRYMFLNTSDGGSSSVQYTMSTTQISWIQSNVALPDSTWELLVIGHVNLDTFGITSSTMTDSTETNASAIISAINQCNGTIIGYLGGHQHIDASRKSGNFRHTAIICDKLETINYYPGYSVTDRTAGSTTEQAVSVISINQTTGEVVIRRVGAGRDGMFGYTYK